MFNSVQQHCLFSTVLTKNLYLSKTYIQFWNGTSTLAKSTLSVINRLCNTSILTIIVPCESYLSDPSSNLILDGTYLSLDLISLEYAHY